MARRREIRKMKDEEKTKTEAEGRNTGSAEARLTEEWRKRRLIINENVECLRSKKDEKRGGGLRRQVTWFCSFTGRGRG